MRFSHFFIDRPIFAAVLSILITLVGADRLLRAAGRAISRRSRRRRSRCRATYPGASAEVVADTVATPLEQEINGVENMLYMSSQATGDGKLTITVTFALGTDLDNAQVLVQNRVAVAEPRLPEEVRRIGVTVRKTSPDMLMVIHLMSPDGSLRPALHLQLRHPAGPRRAGPPRRRRRRARVRRARLRDADLARPGAHGAARPDRRRRASPALRSAERAGRVGRAEPAAGARPGRLPAQRRDARPPAGCRGSSATSSSRPTTTGG